jgi:hypothetical protein
VVLAPLLEIVAPPAATTPPAGAAWLAAPKDIIRQAASAWSAKGARAGELVWFMVNRLIRST